MLRPEHLKILTEDSGISPAVIEASGIHSLEAHEVMAQVEAGVYPKYVLQGGDWIAFPMYRPDGAFHGETVRLGRVPKDKGAKYIAPLGVRSALTVSPLSRPYVADVSVPLVIVEGQKKALAIESRVSPGKPLCVVAMPGCWGWKASASEGGTTATPDLHDLAIQGRQIILIPDSDYIVNNNVRKGWDTLHEYLSSKSSETKVSIALPPQDGTAKQGADDYLRTHTLDELLALARSRDLVMATPRRAKVVSWAEAASAAGTKVPHLVEKVLPDKSIVLLAGHTQSYKTWHAMVLLLDLALGLPFLGHPELEVSEPCASLYVNQEMAENVGFGTRINQLMLGSRYASIPHVQELLEQRLFLLEDAIDLKREDSVELLAEAIEEYGVKVVVLDSLSMSWTGDENSASEVGQLFHTLRALIRRTGCSFIVIHHLVKPNKENTAVDLVHQLRGSGQIVQQSDGAFRFTRDVSSDDLGFGVRVDNFKSRYGVAPESWVSRISTDEVTVEVRYDAQLSASLAEADDSKDDLKDWVREELEKHSRMQSAGLRFSDIEALVDTSWPKSRGKRPNSAALRGALKRLATDGVVETSGKKEAGYTYKFVPKIEEIAA